MWVVTVVLMVRGGTHVCLYIIRVDGIGIDKGEVYLRVGGMVYFWGSGN